MSSANDRQVGGTHYASEYQHWDFAVDAKLGPFEYQISKYGTRHRNKAGRQDVEKAIHFTSKLMELALHIRYQPHHGTVTDALVRCYAQANQLDTLELELMRKVCNWRTVGDLAAVRHLLGTMLETHYPVSEASLVQLVPSTPVGVVQTPTGPVDPQPYGYVNQDRQGP